MRKLKNLISMTLALSIVFSPLLARAEYMDATATEAEDIIQEDSPMLRNTNIANTGIAITFSGGNAVCNASVSAYATNTSSVKISMTLYRYTSGAYVYVNSWSKSANGTFLEMRESSSVSKGTYKLSVTYTAGSESITKSQQKTYS